jgi:hypothetical protein
MFAGLARLRDLLVEAGVEGERWSTRESTS